MREKTAELTPWRARGEKGDDAESGSFDELPESETEILNHSLGLSLQMAKGVPFGFKNARRARSDALPRMDSNHE
jgi:hypothetical protein